MEAKVFEAGLEFARDIGIHDVILEGDSLVLYNAFCGLSEPPATIAPIVGGVLTSYGSVGRVDFSHAKMQGQRLACLLAKHIYVWYCGLLDLDGRKSKLFSMM